MQRCLYPFTLIRVTFFIILRFISHKAKAQYITVTIVPNNAGQVTATVGYKHYILGKLLALLASCVRADATGFGWPNGRFNAQTKKHTTSPIRWHRQLMVGFVFVLLSSLSLHAQTDWNQVIKTASSTRTAKSPEGRAGGDSFGYAVAVDGNYAVVGAYSEDEDAIGGNTLDNAGSVIVFEKIAGTWIQIKKLVASDRAASDNFGWSVAISGTTVVVGAYLEDEDAAGINTLSAAGAAYVFSRDQGGSNNWGQVKKLVASDRAADDYFGWSVAISGTTVVVGALLEDEDAAGLNTRNNAGSAYVFNQDQGGTNNWGQVKKLVASDRAAGDNFGWSVAISGTTVVVGAYLEDEDAAGANTLDAAGAAYVFSRDQGGSNNWGQVKKLVASDRAAQDWFGWSVAIFGTTVVVGAYQEDEDAGSAYIFSRDQGGSNNWGQVKKLIASDRAAGDNFGRSVAISGTTVVVGAFQEDEDAAGLNTRNDAGSAYIFSQDQGGSNNWGQVKKIVASDRAAEDWFGVSVAISGTTVVVGAFLEDEDAAGMNMVSAAGSAYIFSQDQGGSNNWGQAQKIVLEDVAINQNYGYSVAIDGNYAVVGASGDVTDATGGAGLLGAGAAYILQKNGGVWQEVKKLVASDRATGDNFGISVAISGTTVVVGAYLEDEDAAGINTLSAAGSAYVFSRDQGGSNNWGQVKKLVASDRAADDQFGVSVAISGTTVVVGAFRESVYIFSRDQGGSNNWGQVKKIVASDRAIGDNFGISVAISGTTVVVGAYLENEDAAGLNTRTAAGSAYLFSQDQGGGNNWGQVKKLVAADRATNDRFGISVAISGTTVVVGAYLEDEDAAGATTLSAAGSAYVFSQNQGGSNNWGQVKKLVAADRAAGDLFGRSVAITGTTVVVGAYLEDEDAAGANTLTTAGSAYVFSQNQGGSNNWDQVKKLVTSDRAAGDNFGWSIAISGTTVVVGAPVEDEDAAGGNTLPNAGSAYFFEGTTTSPDYTITTTGNVLTITDVSGNGETLDISQNSSNIRFNVTGRTYSIDGGTTTDFTTPADVALSGITSIVVNTATGNDVINVGAFTANLPSLTINGGTGDDQVNFNGDITFATNANLDVDLQNDDASPGVDAITFAINANIVLQGTGVATLKVSKNVVFNNGSTLGTNNGNLTVEANQQASPTTGNFSGVSMGGSTQLQVLGSGTLTVKGKGGNDATGSQIGVYLNFGGVIYGGNNTVSVIGNGGASSGNSNYGILIQGSTSKITSLGGNVTVEGTGGGTGTSAGNDGIRLATSGQITAAGTGAVTVTGRGGSASTGDNNIGVNVQASAKITSVGGNVIVNAYGGGSGTSQLNYGLSMSQSGEISAGGTGIVTITGEGGLATGVSNHGIALEGLITSAGGNIALTGKPGGGSTTYGIYMSKQSGAPVSSITTEVNGGNIAITTNSLRIVDSPDIRTNSSGRVTLKPFTAGTAIDFSFAPDVTNGPLILSDTELDRISTGTLVVGDATMGDITVGIGITRPAATNVQLLSGGDVIISGGGFNTNGGTLLLDPGTSPKAVKPTFNGTDVIASTLSFNSDLQITINGTTLGDGTGSTYTQLNVEGAINLTGVDLLFAGSYVPVGGNTFTIVNNDGTDAIVGTFTGLAEGAILSNFRGSGLNARISYVGGTGNNDVVLTVETPCSAQAGTSTPTVCVGGAITLTSSGGGTGGAYTWSGPAGSGYSSNSQNPTTFTANTTSFGGIYSVTISTTTGCTASATTSVEVKASPTAVAGTSTPSVCVGGAINLTSSGGSGYSWNGPNNFSNNTQNPSPFSAISTNQGGIYSVSVTVGSCTASATTSVEVKVSPTAVAGTSTPIVCVGGAITLTSSGGSSYSWNGPNNFSNNTQNPTTFSAISTNQGGIYSVSVTSTNGCTASATTSVQVISSPNAQAGATPSSVCLGSTINLTSSGGSSYSWNGPSSFSNNTQNPSPFSAISTNQGGIYSVSVTVGSCTASATTSVEVKVSPTAVAGTSTPIVCVGGAITLTSSGGSSYSWNGPNNFSNNTQNPTTFSAISTNQGGIYSVSVTSTNGCTASATTSVQVISSPNAQAGATPSSVCLGSTINLTSSGGSSYSWNGPSSFSNNTQNPSPFSAISTNQGGIYSVSVTVGSCTASATTSVEVKASPTAVASTSTPIVCVGGAINLTSSGGSSYSWNGPSGFNDNTQNPTTFSATSTNQGGVYSVSVSLNGCTASATTSVQVNGKPSAVISMSNAQVCIGQSISLTASGGSSYSWGSSGGSFTSGTNAITSFSSSNASSYTLTVSVSNSVNCSATATATVQVTNTPNASISPSTAQSICVGTSLSLTASGGSVYSWRGPNGFSSNSAMASVNTSSTANSGGYSVTVGNAGNCTATASLQVTISQAIAQVNPSSQSVCVGGTVSLSSVGTGSYSWRGPNNFSSSVQNVSFNLSSSAQWGIYSLTVVSGGCSASTSAEVKQGTVQFGSNSPVCVGGTLQFTASGGGAVYSWYRPTNNFSSSQQNPVIQNVKVSDGGLYFVSVSGSGGCTGSGLLQVMIINTPIDVSFSVSPSSICWGSTVTLSASSGTGSSYSWSGPNGFSGNTRTKTIGSMRVENEGMYRLTVKSGQCWGYSEKEVRINCATRVASEEGVEDQLQVKVWENPTRGKLQVEVRLAEVGGVELEWIDSRGRVMEGWKRSEEARRHELELDVAKYEEGMYLLRVQSGQHHKTIKVWRVN
ncbi:MAG: hypothetical protein U0Y10_10070 [Spirosomataceae bacterium]